MRYIYTSREYIYLLTMLFSSFDRIIQRFSQIEQSQFKIFYHGFEKGKTKNQYEMSSFPTCQSFIWNELEKTISCIWNIWKAKELGRWLRLGLTRVTLQILPRPKKGSWHCPLFFPVEKKPLKTRALFYRIDVIAANVWKVLIWYLWTLFIEEWARWHMTLWPEFEYWEITVFHTLEQ